MFSNSLACFPCHANLGKAFCAGGDVKALVQELNEKSGMQIATDFFVTEYFVDYLIHIYPKPILCWADGVTMGGDGISQIVARRLPREEAEAVSAA